MSHRIEFKTGRVTNRLCPRCHKELRVRENRKTQDKFLGCSGFPRCQYTEKINYGEDYFTFKDDELIF